VPAQLACAASSRCLVMIAERTLAAAHVPPWAVGMSSLTSTSTIVRRLRPASRMAMIRSATSLGTAARPRGRPCLRRIVNFSVGRSTRPLKAADVMTAAEVAELLRVPKSTVEDWARRGIIPSRKIGRRRIYIRSRIEAFLLDNEPQNGAQDP
jgi:excisionase family DNA binding protein